MKKIKNDLSSIFLKDRTFIIAEISANHGQDIGRAVKLIKAAKRCGVDAVKFQAYTPDTMTLDCSKKPFRIRHTAWKGQSLYQLYEKAYTPWKWFKRLKREAESAGLVFFATAFDKTSVDFLEDLGVVMHKAASFEITDRPLLQYMAQTKKPILLSTGMASEQEIAEACEVCGKRRVGLLKCVSAYPAIVDDMNLKTMDDMNKRFNVPIGISDHTLGTAVSVAAVARGACIVEKHFTLSRKDKTPDSFFSLEPQELTDLVMQIRTVESALGSVVYGAVGGQKDNRVFRRSLFVAEAIKKGDVFTANNVRCVRPSHGLAPKYYDCVIGRRARVDLSIGTPLEKEHVVPQKGLGR